MAALVGIALVAAGATYYRNTRRARVDPVVDPKNQTAVREDTSRVAAYMEGQDYGTKLHDDASTIVDCFHRGKKVSKTGHMLGYRTADGPYQWMSYEQVFTAGAKLARAFRAIGMPGGPDAFVGIFAKNKPEWIITEYATYYHSNVVVPLYETLGLQETLFIINQTELSLILVDTIRKAQLLTSNKAQLPTLKHIVVLEKLNDELRKVGDAVGIKLYTYEEMLDIGNKSPDVPPCWPSAQNLATICYTSGTSGMPKGVMLTHANIVADLTTMHVLKNSKFTEEDTMMSFLPLAHMFERVMELVIFANGGRVGYFRGDIRGLSEDLKALKPTVLPVVPRVLNKIYDKVMSEVEKSAFKKFLINLALSYKEQEMKRYVVRQDALLDPIVFGKIRDTLGGRVRLMITGSAPLAGNVLTFMRAVLGVFVIEGYGQTECVAAATTTIEGDPDTGHVGIPVPAVAVKLVDVPEMEYIAAVNGGEVCVKGTTVMKGYYKNEEETKKAIDEDGWLHTGDIGIWQPNGTLKIIDRRKHLFKLSQGEYVSPEKIENVYVRSKFVAQSFVYGESLKSSLIAIVIPDVEVLVPYCKEHMNLTSTMEELCKRTDVKKLILDDMISVGKLEKLHGFEQVRDIHLSADPFSVENDLLTPTMKSRRVQIKTKYAKELADLYSKLE